MNSEGIITLSLHTKKKKKKSENTKSMKSISIASCGPKEVQRKNICAFLQKYFEIYAITAMLEMFNNQCVMHNFSSLFIFPLGLSIK